MTFKEFISALFEKWTCKHEWEQIFNISHYNNENDKYPLYHMFHFKCKKCGKFKKIRSSQYEI